MHEINPKAIELCRVLYKELAPIGIYPALTGGTLYKDGIKKDMDIVLYRNRQALNHFETTDLNKYLRACGLYDIEFFGFVTKAKWQGLDVDIFNPETNTQDVTY